MTPRSDMVPDIPIDPDLSAAGEGAGASTRPGRRRARLAVVVVALALGGAAGAVARYALSLSIPTGAGQFPWGTFITNVSGSAVLGFLLVMLSEQFSRGRLARPVIGTGVIGAYTTFSTYMVGAVQLVRAGRVTVAVSYVLASALVGLVAVVVGMMAARLLLGIERWLQEEAS